MFVCASTRCFPEKTLEESCSLLADLEFDKFEIWTDQAAQGANPSEIARDPEGFVNHLHDFTRLSPVGFYLTANEIDPQEFSGLTRACKLLRIAQVTILSSPLGTPFNSEIDRLKELHAIGSREGVRVSLKTQAGRLTEDPHTAVELCQAVKGLGLTLDPSYYMDSPLGEKALDMAFPYTFHTHLRDSNPGELQVQVGLGQMDYNRLISQLKRYDYDRALSIDLLPELCPEEQRPLELRKLRMLLTTLI